MLGKPVCDRVPKNMDATLVCLVNVPPTPQTYFAQVVMSCN